jgi:hypothetical protein
MRYLKYLFTFYVLAVVIVALVGTFYWPDGAARRAAIERQFVYTLHASDNRPTFNLDWSEQFAITRVKNNLAIASIALSTNVKTPQLCCLPVGALAYTGHQFRDIPNYRPIFVDHSRSVRDLLITIELIIIVLPAIAIGYLAPTMSTAIARSFFWVICVAGALPLSGSVSIFTAGFLWSKPAHPADKFVADSIYLIVWSAVIGVPLGAIGQAMRRPMTRLRGSN